MSQAENTPEPGNQLQGKWAYHAVVVPEGGDPFVISTESATLLARELIAYRGLRVNVYPFYGQRWAISKGPLRRFLLGPATERHPIFEEDLSFEADLTGSLYTGENHQEKRT